MLQITSIALAATLFAGATAIAQQTERDLQKYALFHETGPRPDVVPPQTTTLPLHLPARAHVAFVGNTLFDRAQHFGFFEALLHAAFPDHELVVRNLAWSADALGVQPRPANFADTDQHLKFIQADVVFAAFGFNESFAGPDGLRAFRRSLAAYLASPRNV